MLVSDIIILIYKLLPYNDIINCSYVARIFHDTLIDNDLWHFMIKRYYSYRLISFYYHINTQKYFDIYKLFHHVYSGCGVTHRLNSVHKIHKFTVPTEVSHDFIASLPDFTDVVSIDLSITLKNHPIDIFNLNNMKLLKILILSCNDLHELPLSICSLIKLEEIDLSHNVLTSLPNDFSNLKVLKNLCLFNNKLSSIPGCIYTLPMLTTINLKNNRLIIIPTDLNIKNITF